MGLYILILLQQSQHRTAAMVLSDLMGTSVVDESNQAWAPEQQKRCEEWLQTVGEGHCCLGGPDQKVLNPSVRSQLVRLGVRH